MPFTNDIVFGLKLQFHVCGQPNDLSSNFTIEPTHLIRSLDSKLEPYEQLNAAFPL